VLTDSQPGLVLDVVGSLAWVVVGRIAGFELEGDGIPDVVDGNAAAQTPFLDDRVEVDAVVEVVLVETVAIVGLILAYD